MKKRIYLVLLSVTVLFFSCKDKKDDYAEQLFTNNEISLALKVCIDTAAFYTINALCTPDTINKEIGYTYYDAKSYYLDLPDAAKVIVDTLKKNGFDNNIDTLLTNAMNLAAELCGKDLIRSFWKPLSDSIKFPVPNAILRGGNNALTNYVKQNYQTEFVSVLVNNLLKEQFKELDIISKWNEWQDEYRKITGTYSSIDILTPTAQQMAAGFFRKMALEEEAIRNDASRRGNKNGLFYKVFAIL